MGGRSTKKLGDELTRLMHEQIESLKRQTFLGLDEEDLRQHEQRLKRIRELSADFLAALKAKENAVAKRKKAARPNVTLPGKVEKIIKPQRPHEPEKAQISVEKADDLYREIRIKNTLSDEKGDEVRLKKDAEVDVTVEADKDATTPKNQREE